MSEIISFVLKRLTSALITLLLVSLMIFSAIHALPGGYADVFLGAYATPAAKARIEQQFGLNQPLPVQYFKWVESAARGDFGVSLVTQKPVAEEFAARLPVTATIAVLATLLAVLIGLPAGLIGGLASNSGSGRTISRLFGSWTISVPDFVIGTVLLFVVSRFLPWATIFSTTLLPAVALSALGIGFVMTATRHSTITASGGTWVLAAIARGMPRAEVLRHHVLRNSAIPVVTVLGIYFGYLLGGTVIVEATFTVPGVGRYMLQAVALRDYPVVQAGALITAALFIVLNLSVDIVYALLDPRIRTAQ